MSSTDCKYHIIDKKTEVLSADRINENTIAIDEDIKSQAKQITDCNTEIEKVRGEINTAIGDIDLSSVNTHTTSVGESIKTHITSIKDTIVSHVTSVVTAARDNIRGWVSTNATGTNDTVVASRNTVTTHVTLEANRVLNSSRTTKAPSDTGLLYKSINTGTTADVINLTFLNGGNVYIKTTKTGLHCKYNVWIDGLQVITNENKALSFMSDGMYIEFKKSFRIQQLAATGTNYGTDYVISWVHN